ncbi:MAG TPA: succinylglutamate desuccinylase/aspartoacylase family protein [bacterium]|nr:succinylglutamate desuccinylase/aspartoacylase family protein [bacterium]HPP11709.1 succinylglutamate desuccinylase/aspartoacylase family protein [bacterium]
MRQAGKSQQFLETKDYAQGVRVRLPVLVLTGKKTGPLALVISSQHGRELNGVAVIERVWRSLSPEKVKGRIVFLPVMNPLAVRMRRQDFPVEEPRFRPTGVSQLLYNMNRKWPPALGDDTYAGAVAEAVWKTYWKHADLSLDLHGWTDRSLSLAWAHRKHLKLLRSYGFPYHMVVDEVPQDRGMSETSAFQAGIPHLVNELAPQNTIVPEIVNLGARCVMNLFRAAGMLSGELQLPPVQYEFNQKHEEIEARTPVEGLLLPEAKPGDFLRQGEPVARVLSLETLKTLWQFRTPKEALVFNLGGSGWGEDSPPSNIVFPGQLVSLLKVPDAIIKNG